MKVDTLRIVGIRRDEFVVLGGMTFETEAQAREAFASVPVVHGAAFVLELIDGDGDVIDDAEITGEMVIELLTVMGRVLK